jgi:hypothetical protein
MGAEIEVEIDDDAKDTSPDGLLRRMRKLEAERQELHAEVAALLELRLRREPVDPRVVVESVRQLCAVVFAAILVLMAVLVRESLPYVTGALGGVLTLLNGAAIAERVKRQTLAKVAAASQSQRPPAE